MVEITQDNRRAIAYRALSLCSNLSAVDRQVAASLLSHFNNFDERCDPSIHRIALLLGKDERVIRRSIGKIAAERGDEESHNRSTVFFAKITYGGRHNCSDYEPLWDKFADVCDEWDEKHSLRTAELNEVPEQKCGMKPRLTPPVRIENPGQNCPQTLTKMSVNPDKIVRKTDKIVTQTHSKTHCKKSLLEPSEAACEKKQQNPSSQQKEKSKKGLGIKEEQVGYQQTILLPIKGGRQTSHSEAAKQSAIGRINDEMFKRGGNIYEAYVDLSEPVLNDLAVEKEMKQRGAGIRFILKLIEDKTLEAFRTQKVGAA